MKHLLSRFALPLLMKELIEQSARRRLFVVRVLYAALLYLFTALFLIPILSRRQFTPLDMLGIGKQIYHGLMALQFAGIYVFLPALCCGVITIEKERNTLALLFLTRLSNGTIILEKFGSRLVTMFNLLLTSLPLLAFTYALGGTTLFDLTSGLWFLMLGTLLIASVSILASSYFRGTTGAFLGTYFVLAIISFSPIFMHELLGHGWLRNGVRQWLRNSSWLWLIDNNPDKLVDLMLAVLFPPGLFVTGVNQASVGKPAVDALLLGLMSIPTLCLVTLCLLLARQCLFSRAFLAAANPLLNLFKKLDRVFHRANERFTRGVVLVNESQSLPGERPVAWRESAKRSLGQFRYLVRILVLLEIPTLFFILYPLSSAGPTSVNTHTISAILVPLWLVVVLLIATQSASLVTGERSRQTLDVLLTSPLTSRQIVVEKMSGVRRLILVSAIPLLTCVVFQTWWRYQLEGSATNPHYVINHTAGLRSHYYLWHEYLASGVLNVMIYLPFVAWLSLWMGIRSKSSTRAIFASLAVLVAWCVLPMVVTISIFDYLHLGPSRIQEAYPYLMLLLLLSPASLIIFTEAHGLHWVHWVPYLAALINAAFYATCWFVIRRAVLKNAGRYLGRADSPPIAAEPTPEVTPTLASVTN